MKLIDLGERFGKLHEKTDDCWMWKGALDGKGYGHMGLNGHNVRSHRVGWYLRHGKWPKELDHLCRNRKCVKPDHLEEVTHAENIRRANIKRDKNGRYVK